MVISLVCVELIRTKIEQDFGHVQRDSDLS